MAEISPDLGLPDGVDTEGYKRIRRLMRLCVLRVWRTDRVLAGVDPWIVVDEAWRSMAQNGFHSEGPFEPFALRVARNKAIDTLNRAETRRRDLSLDQPLSRDPAEAPSLGETTTGAPAAEDAYFASVEHLDAIRRLALVEDAIVTALTQAERAAFRAVRIDGKSRAAVGREMDPPITGQRVGQIVAAATLKIKAYVEENEER